MEYRKLSEIKKLEGNPRVIRDKEFKTLCNSIRDNSEYFEARPVILSNRTGELIIIAGNQRYEAAKSLKLKQVPTFLIEGLTELKEKEIIIRDNISNGDFNFDILANEWSDLPLVDWGVDLPEDWLNEGGGEGLTNPDEVPEVPKVATTKPGDIWLCGKHRVMCGDSTKAEDVERLMGGVKADAIVTDPPYGIGIDGQKKSVSSNPKHNRKEHEFRGWDKERPKKEVFDYIIGLAIPSAIFGGNYFADLLPPSRGWVYWGKGQDGLTMSDGELVWTNCNKPLRAVTVNRAALQGSQHPTQKPIDVVKFALEYIGPDKKAILDLFGGSGSTLIAAEQTGRTAFLMEIDCLYVDVTVQRFEDFTGEKATLEV